MGVKQLTKKVEKRVSFDKELEELIKKRKTKIKVVGCGGAGGNTVSRLMEVGIVGAETIAVNTDAQDLYFTDAHKKILIGKKLTKGLGAGADPKLGMEAARENKDEIRKALSGSDMVFLTCGLGGGTGTGSIPVVGEVAKRIGALTVAVVTLPFTMEGKQRMENAMFGLENLEKVVDTLIVIPNDKLLEIVPDVSLITAFKIADEVLVNAVKGITELVTKPGLVNRDFADVKAIMGSGGLAMIGLGESDSENRAYESVEKALNNPLITVDVENAKGALINIMGGPDLTLKEAQQIIETVSKRLSADARIIWGAQIEKELGERIKTLLILTGVSSPQIFGPGKPWSKEKKKEIEKVLGIEFIEWTPMKLKTVIENLKRVLSIARKPRMEEYTKVLKICLLGILFIGLVGFVFYLIFAIILGGWMLYSIKTIVGRENVVLDAIAAKAKANNLNIKALIRIEEIRGYIFVEGEREDIESIVKTIPQVRGLIKKPIEISKIENFLKPRKVEVELNIGDTVEVIGGPFKGEKGKVVRYDKAKRECTIELLEVTVPIPVTVSVDLVKIIKKVE